MTTKDSLERFGFKFGDNGAHSARSMMLAELRILFQDAPQDASQEQYRAEISDHNILNKPTTKSRSLTFRHLSDLYGLDPSIPLFRAFRLLWSLSEKGQAVLALQLALIRDPLLRLSMDFIVEKPLGDTVTREEAEALLKAPNPDRFSPASLKSFAQNINGSWTQAGFLQGKVRKVRVKPEIAYTNVVFALFVTYLEGATGERLFQSRWSKLFGTPMDELEEQAIVAAQRGIIDFKQSGGVTEVRFPGFLTQDEEQWRHE